METIANDVLYMLKKANTAAQYVNLMLASRIIGSDQLYLQAFNGLRNSNPRVTIEQARILGVDIVYEIYNCEATCRHSICTGRLRCNVCGQG